MEELKKLDSKDYEILRELDTNFRQSFSKIGKKIKLSKNSVALRFDKIKKYTLHNMTGLNNEVMGYTLVKVFYSFYFYNEQLEREIINQAKRHDNIVWVARYYGKYDLAIALLVDDLREMIYQINSFDEGLAEKISHKDLQIIFKHYFFRYNFLHKKPVLLVSKIQKGQKKTTLTKMDKKIISTILYNPRMNVVDVAKKVRATPKTVANRIKHLEETGAIMGYFITLDPTRFNHSTFKLLIQLQKPKISEEFENYLSESKNIKYIAKMLGIWDYEIDLIYPTITELQNQIEKIKQKFQKAFKKIEIISFGKRIHTNYPKFLMN